ncbi:carbon-monoxide dehydrogenase small subunit [Streptomyces sp. SolWspMP-sol7th]|nr:carbon-monoxide dehydrogenase small subunit [Streptomyces sp. SolWspMP-sol7th]
MRFLHRPARRSARLRLPRRRRTGGGPARRHGRRTRGVRGQAHGRGPRGRPVRRPAPLGGEPPEPGGPALSPVQQAFVDAGAVQCGFCTPGLLVAADDLLERVPSPSDADIREALSGNLCRCTGYEKILDAVRLAAARQDTARTEEAR